MEDYCEGPGQALIVTPKGEVKPCCGFASDLDQLTIGNVHDDTVAQIIERGRSHPYVGKVFREGLTAIREDILARDPEALPGETSNHCFFCWYVLVKNLVSVPAGAGGKPQSGRTSLPMAGQPLPPPGAAKGESVTALLMVFDGRTVFVGRELPPREPHNRGEVFLLNVAGPEPVERAERFSGAWDGTWFEEDYCEGPGQALIVNPRGEVKPCCGFASDLDQLTIGNIYTDTAAQVIRRGRRHPYVGKVFREGLTAIRDEILARDPNALPAATSNHCFFCWYVLSKNLASVPFSCAKSPRTGALALPLVDQAWSAPD